MYAVIKTGGKQYKVAQGDEIVVEKLVGDQGDTLVFGEVLMIGNGSDLNVGAPLIGGAQVVGEVVGQVRGEKIIIFKKKRRNTYKRKQGHRQHQTVIKITDILAKGGATATAKKAEAPKAKAAAPKKAAAKTEAGEKPAAKPRAPRAKKTEE